MASELEEWVLTKRGGSHQSAGERYLHKIVKRRCLFRETLDDSMFGNEY